MREFDVDLPDGRVLHAHDTGEAGDAAPVVLWHGGTPNTGEPPAPLLTPGVRWIGVDRPGYGGSTRRPGRDVASVAGDVAAVLDHLGIERCVTVGHSGGGAHALACAALLPGRVTAALSISALAPYDGTPEWFDGIGPAGRASLGAALRGRAAKEEFEAAGSDAIDFLPEDWTALEGPWGWFGPVVQAAMADGPGGLVDDDLAGVAPWGFDPAVTTVPVTLLHGEADRVVPVGHARRLAAVIDTAELRTVPGASHLTILADAPAAVRELLS